MVNRKDRPGVYSVAGSVALACVWQASEMAKAYAKMRAHGAWIVPAIAFVLIGETALTIRDAWLALRWAWRTGLAHVLIIAAAIIMAAWLGGCAVGKPHGGASSSGPSSAKSLPKMQASSSPAPQTLPRVGSPLPSAGLSSSPAQGSRSGSSVAAVASEAGGMKRTANPRLCSQVEVVAEGTPIPTTPPLSSDLVPVAGPLPRVPTVRAAYIVGGLFGVAFGVLVAMLIYNLPRRK